MNIPRCFTRVGALLILGVLMLSSPAAADFKKIKIAVLDFELHGNQMKTNGMGAIVAEWFTTAMVQAGRFDVIERAMLNKILAEQKLAMSGIVDENSASKLGKILGVENVITGSVLNLGSKIEVNARIIDVESGSIVAAENVVSSSAANLQLLVNDLTKQIVYHFPMTGYVVKKTNKQVLIDLGRAAGLHVGMKFFVFKEGEIIKHPKTGEILDVEQIRTGRIKITRIRNNVAEAEIIDEQGEGITYGQMVQSIRERGVKRKSFGSRTELSAEKQNALKRATGILKVQVTPEDAKVRILNIGPKYVSGIKLPAGRYHLEVSKSAFHTITKWITLPEGDETIVSITLKPFLSSKTAQESKTSALSVTPAPVLPRVSSDTTFPPEPADTTAVAKRDKKKVLRSLRVSKGYQRDDFTQGNRDNLSSGGQGPQVLPLTTGSYMMGGSRFTEKPRHYVSIKQPVFLTTTEITFADYMIFCKDTGRQTPDDFAWGREDRPVINVSWNDAQDYAHWLTKQTGSVYRLPFETEWEWAAKYGEDVMYSWGNSFKKNMANCKECDIRWDHETAPIRSFPPNKFGFYDMAGNVWEWVQDCWADNYVNAPDNQAERKYTGKCSNFTVRGGAWNSPRRQITTTSRLGIWGETRSNYIGFRLVKDPNLTPPATKEDVSSAPIMKAVPSTSSVPRKKQREKKSHRTNDYL